MVYSELVKDILDKAETVKKEKHFQYISATLIVAICSGFCHTKYTGGMNYYYVERYEEERLRYVYKKIFRIGANFQKRILRNISENPELLDREFDLAGSEAIATLRGKNHLSADVLFLKAISDMMSQKRDGMLARFGNIDVMEQLEDIDANIYDYVIQMNQDIIEKLQTKVDEAVALRDWQPAKKFVEPEELVKLFFDRIVVDTIGNVLHITIPCFFGTDDLHLSIYKADEILYLHDNGCAINHLKKQVEDEQKVQRILNKICNVQWIKDGRVWGTGGYEFWYYLQRLIFIAHADLFYTRTNRQFYSKHEGLEFCDETLAEEFDVQEYLGKLKKELIFGYDENKGLYLAVHMTYSRNSTTCSYLIETLDDNKIRVSDRRKGLYEGEILESFYWDYDDIMLYKNFIGRFTNRFGGFLQERNVYLIEECEKWLPALFRFINLAVLLSEVGCEIRLPDLKHKEPKY